MTWMNRLINIVVYIAFKECDTRLSSLYVRPGAGIVSSCPPGGCQQLVKQLPAADRTANSIIWPCCAVEASSSKHGEYFDHAIYSFYKSFNEYNLVALVFDVSVNKYFKR